MSGLISIDDDDDDDVVSGDEEGANRASSATRDSLPAIRHCSLVVPKYHAISP